MWRVKRDSNSTVVVTPADGDATLAAPPDGADETGVVVADTTPDLDDSAASDADTPAVVAPDVDPPFALGTVSLQLPGPGRIDRHWVSAKAVAVGRLAVLSPGATRLPMWVAAVAAAVWAALVGLLGAGLLTALSGVAAPEATLRSTIWLVAHHAPLSTDAGTVTLLPLGLMLITILPLRRSGRFLAAQLMLRTTTGPPGRPHVATAGATAVASYAVIAGLVAAGDRVEPSVAVIAAVVWSALVAVAAGGWGLVRQRRGRVPRPPFAVAVAVTVAVPLSIAVLLTVVSVAAGLGDIRLSQEQIAQPGMEQVGLTLLQLAYLPNLVLWAAAFVMGPGLTLGMDRGMSPFTSGEAVLPDLPLLTALPMDAPNWTAILPITVALGGALGAVVFARLLPERRLRRRITRAIALALAAGAVWWVLMALAGGSLGDGRLDHVGPAAGTALAAVVLTGAGTLMWALLPTLASDARPVAVDLRERVSTAASAAKEAGGARLPTGKATNKRD